MIFGIDFDGTCVEHEFPKVGKDVPNAVNVLSQISEHHHIILWTMRSDKTLQDAVNWFKSHGIPLYGINENPTQQNWTKSPKAYAQVYIDDTALGCPLTANVENNKVKGRPFVDWFKVEEILKASNII